MDSGLKNILEKLHARKFAPVYLIDGEEGYYMDMVTSFFETEVLTPAERDFNLMVFYGREAKVNDIINACRRYPMFADRQVVIVKDAAQLEDLGALEPYIKKPAPTTILLLEHRFKKVDGRMKIIKSVKDAGVYYTSEKVKDELLPEWIQSYGQEVGFVIGVEEARTLAANLGSELQKIANELAKIRINVPEEKVLSMDLIRKYIGISREYTAFELPEALTSTDWDKLYKMMAYFFANPKNAPMPLITGSFFSHFSKLYQACYMVGKPEKDQSATLGAYGARLRTMMATLQHWPLHRIERGLLIISKYSAKSVGINSNLDNTELLKEFLAQMMH